MSIVVDPAARVNRAANATRYDAGWSHYLQGGQLDDLTDPTARQGWREAQAGEAAALALDTAHFLYPTSPDQAAACVTRLRAGGAA